MAVGGAAAALPAPGGNHGKLGERGASCLLECTSNWPKKDQTWSYLQEVGRNFALNVMGGGRSIQD